MTLDWSSVQPKPTKRQIALYRRWRTYLSDSRLTTDEQHRRATAFAEEGRKIPED